MRATLGGITGWEEDCDDGDGEVEVRGRAV